MSGVTHPGEFGLVELVLGNGADPEASKARLHLQEGCIPCEETLRQLTGLKNALEDERAFDASFADLKDAFSPAPTGGRAGQTEPAAALAQDLLDRLGDRDALETAARSLDASPERGLALLRACQGAVRLVSTDPHGCLGLAEIVRAEAARTPGAIDAVETARAMAEPSTVSRDELEAESEFLSSEALNCLGQPRAAREAACRARVAWESAGDEGFGLALADFVEGSAASFQNEYEEGRALLGRALERFVLYGQDHWVGRAEAAIATLESQRGRDLSALIWFDRALEHLDHVLDASVFCATLLNKASSLAHLERLAPARAIYVQALGMALEHRLASFLQVIRNGLAEIDFRRGDLSRALTSFTRLARGAQAADFPEHYLFAMLYIAEIHARRGELAEMTAALDAVRGPSTPFRSSVAFTELFTCLDQGDLESGLIAHVRDYLDGLASGSSLAYESFRKTGS